MPASEPIALRVAVGLLALTVGATALATEPVVGGPCEGCEAVFAGKPKELASVARIAPPDEPGEAMVVTGRVVDLDGKARPNVIIYAYQTNARGIYPAPVKSLGRWPDRHGRLRGWVVSDARGRYTFETIRPGSYPSREAPQHIHMHVIEPDCATYYIDELVFTDDELLAAPARAAAESARAGSGITTPTRDARGTWRVTRDIRLGHNIPGYPRCGAGRDR